MWGFSMPSVHLGCSRASRDENYEQYFQWHKTLALSSRLFYLEMTSTTVLEQVQGIFAVCTLSQKVALARALAQVIICGVLHY